MCIMFLCTVQISKVTHFTTEDGEVQASVSSVDRPGYGKYGGYRPPPQPGYRPAPPYRRPSPPPSQYRSQRGPGGPGSYLGTHMTHIDSFI